MLVLSRKTNESVTLKFGDKTANIKFIEIKGRQAKIGIEAEKEISIIRDNAINKKIRSELNNV